MTTGKFSETHSAGDAAMIDTRHHYAISCPPLATSGTEVTIHEFLNEATRDEWVAVNAPDAFPATDRHVSAILRAGFGVYRCDRIGIGETPRNEHLVSTHATFAAAAATANAFKRADRDYSFVVGEVELFAHDEALVTT